jgi:hypothetical protein
MITEEMSAEDRRKAERLTVGGYVITRYGEEYWLVNRFGEGMQVLEYRMREVMDELWEEF